MRHVPGRYVTAGLAASRRLTPYWGGSLARRVRDGDPLRLPRPSSAIDGSLLVSVFTGSLIRFLAGATLAGWLIVKLFLELEISW